MSRMGIKRVPLRLLLVIAASVVVAAYLIAPLLAGAYEIGDRWGPPRIYPVSYHEALYLLGWDLTEHQEKKPRVGYWYRSELRPWFYGLPSGNSTRPQTGPGDQLR
jgi:hypothetical protein